MPRHLRKRYPGAKYHVTNRGNGRQRLFYHTDDYRRFLDQLVAALDQDGVRLYAYCLMVNHFHIFVETPLGNIDRFMDRLGTAYAMYFRYKHYHPGHCFQGRYKSPLVEGDEYITRLTRYIHLNPVCVDGVRGWDAELKWSYLRSYAWSSLRGYLSKQHSEDSVDYRWLGLMGRSPARARQAYSRYMRRQIGREDELLREAFDAGPYAIGDASFVSDIARWVKLASRQGIAPQDIVVSDQGVSLEKIELAVLDEFGLSSCDLRARYQRGLRYARGAFIELACTLGQVSQRRMAAYLGSLSEHSVGKTRQFFRLEKSRDPELRRRMEHIISKF